MANDKKLVEAITSMEEDFAQWYTDVVKKAEPSKKYPAQSASLIFLQFLIAPNARNFSCIIVT